MRLDIEEGVDRPAVELCALAGHRRSVYSRPMANQIVLSWDVDVTNTSLGPAGAATRLAAVPLYNNPVTDPVLGALFGLTVATGGDVTTTPNATTARRTLTLNMTNVPATRKAPPPFPCHPITSTPPVLPGYPLRRTVTLAGSFFVTNGSATVPTTATQMPALVAGNVVQFLSQQGVFYTVSGAPAPTATTVTLTTPYTGTTGNTGAFKEVAAPVTIAAIYSTSPLDTAGVGTVTPAVTVGPGARTISLTYTDSLGAGPFTVTTSLLGKRPAPLVLAGGSIDIAVITGMFVASTGAFTNSVGQITLVELSTAPPGLPANPTRLDLQRITDEGQLLIDRALAYLPPSYFALAQQGASSPQLAGDFIVTTGSKDVPTTVDQTATLAAGNIIQFASQLQTYTPFGAVDVRYTVAAVTAPPTPGSRGLVTLTSPYTGLDDNNTGGGPNTNAGTKGNLGTEVIKKPTGAQKVDPPSAAAPSNAQLSGPLGQFVALEVAAPPPNPPLSPATVPAPIFLSDLFTQTLRLALAVPVTPRAITFV